LDSDLESYPNLRLKSPKQDKKVMHMESIPMSCHGSPVMSPNGDKFDLEKVNIKEKTEVKNLK
jgi:hypothetical protein